MESAGIATTGISLIREHTEAIKPPRALWVPFEFGRPFGAPLDADFQRDVLRAALGTFGHETGPTIDDYPHDAPGGGSDEGWACAIDLPAPEPVTDLDAALAASQRELSLLRPWYEQSRRERGRTAIGVSGVPPEAVDEMAAALVRYAYGEDPAVPESARHPLPLLIRYLADDLRAFYAEATAAQPGGGYPNPVEFARWFLTGTRIGDVLYRVRDRLVAQEDPRLRGLAFVLIPRAFGELRPS